MPKGKRSDKKSNAMNSVTTQIKRMAKKGKMPTALVGGSNADQTKAFEAIQDAYTNTPAVNAYMQAMKATDQPSVNRWYIRTPDGGTALMPYPQGATDKAKQGALKMFAWNKTQKAASVGTKWSKSAMNIKDRQSKYTQGYADVSGKYFVYKDAGGRFRLYDIAKGRTVDQGKGADLTFNRLKDAQAYARTRK